MSETLSGTELEAVVSKLRWAEAELRILIEEDEDCSDLRAVIERLQEIQLRIQLQS
jgi:hypothetical protein